MKNVLDIDALHYVGKNEVERVTFIKEYHSEEDIINWLKEQEILIENETEYTLILDKKIECYN